MSKRLKKNPFDKYAYCFLSRLNEQIANTISSIILAWSYLSLDELSIKTRNGGTGSVTVQICQSLKFTNTSDPV